MTDPSPAAVALSKAREALEPFARRHFDMDAPSDTPRLIKVTVANLKKASEAVIALAELAAVPVDVERLADLLTREVGQLIVISNSRPPDRSDYLTFADNIISILSTPATPTAVPDGRDQALEALSDALAFMRGEISGSSQRDGIIRAGEAAIHALRSSQD